MQYELLGQASQTRSVEFVHGVTSYVPEAHSGLHRREKLPPVQNEFPGHLVHTLFVTFVHAVVSYVPAWHADEQFFCSPCRQYDSLAHPEHTRSDEFVHGADEYIPCMQAVVHGLIEVPPVQNELSRHAEQIRSV
jgi:hypothetical protein